MAGGSPVPDPFENLAWRRTSIGTPIALHASASPEQLARSNARPIVLIGGVHGDEPEGVELASRAIEWLSAQPGGAVAPWAATPCLNVDGFARRERTNARGVDLNRNYPSKDWSSECAKPRYFPGVAPGSEVETQAIVELARSLKPRLFIHCHSWEPCIVVTGEPARADAERLARSSGYEARDSIGYPTPGSLSSFGWRDLAIPVICIEERDSERGGGPTLEGIWPRFAAGFAEVFRDFSSRGAP